MDQLALGALLPWQWRWLLDPARVRVGCCGRRVGKSTVVALEAAAQAVGVDLATMQALPAERTASTTFVAVNLDQAAALLEQARRWVDVLGALLGREVVESGTQEVVRLRNGRQLLAKPGSAPRAIRGVGGHLVLDEFAHAESPDELWRAAAPIAGPSPARPDGFRISVISTPSGPAGRFFDLVERPPPGTSVHRVSVVDAAREGLPVDVDALEREVDDPLVWQTEYLAEFGSPGGAFIEPGLLEAAAADEGELPDTFVAYAAGWDPARTRDGSSMVEVARAPDGVAWVLSCMTMKRANWEAQEREARLVAARVGALDVDSAGVGSASAERLVRTTSNVKAIPLNSSTERDRVLTGLADAFRRGQVRILRRHRDLRNALTAIRREVTATGAIRVVLPRSKSGHADEAVALALALSALRRAHGGRLGVAAGKPLLWETPSGSVWTEEPRRRGGGVVRDLGPQRAGKTYY